MTPEVRYAPSGTSVVAYQLFGEGERTVLFIPDLTGHLEVQWEEPAFARNLERLGTFARVLMVDRRGVGLGGPVNIDTLTVRDWTDDLLAACDHAGVTDPAVIACGAAAALAVTMASENPTRVSHLVLLGGTARVAEAADYPIGLPSALLEQAVPHTAETWGSGEMLSWAAPDRFDDPRLQAWFAKLERNATSPPVAAAIQQWALDFDVRSQLGSVSAPTLVMHREADPLIPVDHGRYLAEHIPGAHFASLPGSAHLCFGARPLEWIDEIREFITGSRRAGARDRAMATVVFTDLVDSTPRAAGLGDERWQDLLHRYRRLVQTTVTLFGGEIVDCTGDGHLLRFATPSDAVECAVRLISDADHLGLSIRAGAHVGEVETRDDLLSGIVVHIGARIGAEAAPGELWVSRTIVDVLEGSHFCFEPMGERILKGVHGSWTLSRVGPNQDHPPPLLP
ncbi:MAG: adenylate/guanylate cyclase domain-containing protein [Acidimicrobiales bacterium]